MNAPYSSPPPRIKTIRSKWKPYPSYRPSGVEWLGNVPEHWTQFRLSDLARYGYKTFTDGDWIESPYITDQGIRLIQTGNIGVGQYKEQGYRYISDDTFTELGCTEILPGDVLICRLADPVGRACIAPDLCDRMITSVDVCILKLGEKANNQYLVFLFSSAPYLNYMSMLCRGGTRDRISRSMLGQQRLALPSLPEQQFIAEYLDLETSKIDALVAKKERLIELLKEKRSALISNAVTKGLNPKTRLKDSGVEWLGEIPEHWEVKPLKALLVRNDSGAWGTDSTEEGNIVLRSTEQTIDGKWLIATPARRLLTKREASQTRLEVDDLVVTKSSGSEFHIGKTSIVNDSVATLSCGFSNFMQRLRVDSDHIARFFWYLMNCPVAREQLVFLSSTTTGLGNLNGSILGSIYTPTAPKIEQYAIADFLDSETGKIDALIAKVEEAIERLKEYRIALITAAVTGGIDVRGPAE